MDTFTVKFEYFDIDLGGDGRGGDIGFEIRLNNVVVAHRWGNEIEFVPNHSTVQIQLSQNIASSDTVEVFCHVWDTDRWGDDDAGSFRTTHRKTDDFGQNGKKFSQRLTNSGMDVTLNYRVSFSPDVPRFPDGPSVALDTTKGLRGVIVYTEPNFKKLFASAATTSQFFGAGSYILPRPEEFIFKRYFISSGPGVPPSSISSIRVGAGFFLRGFLDIGGTGQFIEVNQNTAALPSDWDNKINLIEVLPVLVPH